MSSIVSSARPAVASLLDAGAVRMLFVDNWIADGACHTFVTYLPRPLTSRPPLLTFLVTFRGFRRVYLMLSRRSRLALGLEMGDWIRDSPGSEHPMVCWLHWLVHCICWLVCNRVSLDHRGWHGAFLTTGHRLGPFPRPGSQNVEAMGEAASSAPVPGTTQDIVSHLQQHGHAYQAVRPTPACIARTDSEGSLLLSSNPAGVLHQRACTCSSADTPDEKSRQHVVG